jgi:class 3 adenylate cyclase
MKSIIQSAVSYLGERFEACQFNTANSTIGAIVTGYSRLSETNQQKLLQENCNRRLVTILYADIADYARLTEDDGAASCLRLVEGKRIFKACIAATQGKLAHFTGNAILAEFKDVDSALLCAINVQLATRQWNSNLNPVKQVRYRIGINFCEVISDQEDIYEKTIDLASRLEGLAHTGGICVPQSVRENLRDKSRIRFISLGKRYLKNINESIEVFWLEIDGKELVDLSLPGSAKISAVAS